MSVKEGCYYANGDRQRLVCLVLPKTIVYQECRNNIPIGPREEGTESDFQGWTLMEEKCNGKGLDRHA